MATAAELLAATASGDSTLIIDNYLRTIKIPSTITCLGVENDDEVLRLNFKMPRYLGETDLSTFSVRINYLNAKGESDVYTVSDLTIVDDSLTFSWLVGPTATKYKGNTKFNVCMRIVDADFYVQQEYNTTIATLPVLEGLECDESVVEYYSDILEQWRNQLFGLGDSIETNLRESSQNEIARIHAKATEIVNTGNTIEANLVAKSEEEQQKVADKGIEVLASIPEDYTTTYKLADEAARTKADAIVCSASGDIIKLEDSSDDPIRGLRVFGKTTQTTTTGAQLLNIPDTDSKVDRGLTQTISNGACKVVGTANSNASFNLTLAGVYSSTNVLFTLTSGTYTVSDCALYTYDGTTRTKYSDTFTLNSEVGITWVATRSYDATETVNETTYPMLNRGDVALPWELYTGGNAAPNPDYPQAMVVNPRPDVIVYGKNLLAPKNNSTSGYTATVNPDGSVTVTGAANTTDPIYLTISRCSETNPLRLSKDKKYYAWGESSNGLYLGTKTLDSNGTPAWATISTWNKHVGTDFTNFVQVYIESNGHEVGDTRLCGTYRFQLEVGDKFTGFEEYKELQPMSVLAALFGVPAFQNGNYTDSNGRQWICDEIDFERGIHIQRVGKSTFTNAFEYVGASYADGSGVFYCGLAGYDTSDFQLRMMSTHFRFAGSSTHNSAALASLSAGEFSYIRNPTAGARVYFAVAGITTKEEATEWLANNTPVVYYPLKTPIETELTAEQLASFRALHTNYPNTTFVNDAGATMEVKYNADTKIWVRDVVSSANVLVDDVTGVLYTLRVSDGQLTINPVDDAKE